LFINSYYGSTNPAQPGGVFYCSVLSCEKKIPAALSKPGIIKRKYRC